MGYPNFFEERKLWKKGFKKVICLDESGRGSLAGPVLACAVLIDSEIKNLKGIKDSKILTKGKREKFYKILINHPKIHFGIGKVSQKIIDKINILEASKLAMKRAVINLSQKLGRFKIDFLILDGNFKIDFEIPQKPIIKGDKKVLSCAIASIIAKVKRDKIMVRYSKKYPQYGFEKHKGYATRFHIKILKKYGSCLFHRKSFKPIKK